MKRDTVISGLWYSLVGRTVVVFSGLVVSVLLARHFGAEVYGQWSSGTVFASFVAVFIDGGLGNTLLRNVSRVPQDAERTLGLVVKGRLILGVLACPLVVCFAWWFAETSLHLYLLLLIVVARYCETIQSSFEVLLVSLGYYRAANLSELARKSLWTIAVILLVTINSPIVLVGISAVFVMLLSLVGFLLATRGLVRLTLKPNLDQLWREGRWFWASSVLSWANTEVNQLVLKKMAGDLPVGVYAAAFRFIAFFLAIPHIIAYTVVPRLFKTAVGIGDRPRQLEISIFYLAALGSLIAIESTLVGRQALLLLYGPQFSEAAVVLEVLGWFLYFHFLRITPTWFLTTTDRVPIQAAMLAVACSINILANVLWVPRFGGLGAACAILLSETALLVMVSFLAIRSVGLRILGAMLAGSFPIPLGLLANWAIGTSHVWYFPPILTSLTVLAILGFAGMKLHRNS